MRGLLRFAGRARASSLHGQRRQPFVPSMSHAPRSARSTADCRARSGPAREPAARRSTAQRLRPSRSVGRTSVGAGRRVGSAERPPATHHDAPGLGGWWSASRAASRRPAGSRATTQTQGADSQLTEHTAAPGCALSTQDSPNQPRLVPSRPSLSWAAAPAPQGPRRQPRVQTPVNRHW
jgi:hypothetical protein